MEFGIKAPFCPIEENQGTSREIVHLHIVDIVCDYGGVVHFGVNTIAIHAVRIRSIIFAGYPR